MAKKTTTPKTPEIYQGLELNNNTLKHYCLVQDKLGGWFKFSSVSSNHIVAEATSLVYKDWTTFDDLHEGKLETLTALHTSLFKAPPIKDSTRIDISVACWHKLVLIAEDRLKDSPKNPAAKQATASKKSYESRLYIPVKLPDGTWPPTEIKTPQAKACMTILRETATQSDPEDHTVSLTEKDFHAAIMSRASELKTRQDPWRIFQYYRSLLVQIGVLKHD
jgi:hypothetical protein